MRILHKLKYGLVIGIILTAACGRSSSDAPAETDDEPSASAPAAVPAGGPPTAQVPGTGTEVGGLVFEDRNRSGAFDGGDVVLAGQTVLLTNPTASQRLQSTTTDDQGRFTFRTPPPGEYRMSVQIPKGYMRSTDDSFTMTVAQGLPLPQANFGIIPR